jgi:F420-dependent oxidoreductase-like protein
VKVEFAIQIEPQLGYSYEEILAVARDAEQAGFAALWVSDHFFLDAESTDRDCFEAWTLLAALARETRTLRLGTLVSCQSYRNPALLAKIAAGVDHMSRGRLEFGVGAGWKELEYRAYGYDFPAAATRIDELVDTLEIVRRLWTTERATYRGKRYAVDGALSAPKPVQRPHPRIWVAGSKPRLLGVVARYADAVNVGGFPSVERYRAAMGVLDQACRRIGRGTETILRSHFGPFWVAKSRAELDRLVDENATRARTSPEKWRAARPHLPICVPEDAVDRLREYVDAGARYFMLLFAYGHEREMLRLFADRVAPSFSQ